MAKGDSNPSLSLDTLFPTLSDESFLQFLKDYYRFLQSTKLTLTDVSGTFVKGEVITGADSKATGTVFFVGTNEIVVVMNTELPLDSTEVITGSTSGATATISLVKDNVIRESARLKDARSQYVSGDEFFQLLKDEVNSGYPSTSQADRRLLYNRIRDLLQSKSTEEAYRFLFKAFFDENIEIRFPGDDLLRVSDGKFEKTSLIRVIPTNTNAFPIGGIFDFLNKTIRGQTSGAVGTVVNISISFLGGVQYAEFNLKLVSGEFEAGETVADVLQSRLSTEVFGIIGDIQINDGGSGYSVGEAITITGDGAEATAEVSSISTGPINKILVNVPGYGYRLNTKASINNTDTAGANLQIAVTSIANTYTVTDGANTYTVGDTSRIQIVNRGFGYQRSPVITLVDSTIQSIGLLSERLITIANSGTDYAVGEILTFTGGSGNSAAGQVASVGNTAPFGEENILFEDDFVLTQEQEVNGLKSAIKSEDWGNLGSILRIELTNLGIGYLSNNLPTLTLESANTVSGANASFTVNDIQGVSANVEVDIANNAVGIGSIREISIRNPGINFSSANVSANTVGDGNANLEAIISGLNVNRGFFTNDDGKISFKIIQDSFFYQDFSYVIRSGLIINAYQELVKETVHPAGLEFFGEIVITSIIALTAEFKSQIDQSPRPLALSSFLSLYPVGVNLPFAGAIREVEITPEFIDQKIKPRISKFLKPSGASDDKNLSIREIAFERGISVPAEFSAKEIVNKLHLYIDVALFPTFSDVATDTIPIIPVELDYILSGISNIIDTHREYQIEIAPIRMEQPLAVRDFNVREIEIVKNIDAAVNIDDVKTQTTFLNADQYGETPLSFFAESLISSLSGNTFLDFTGFETPVQTFFRRIDTQGLEVDIELVSTDLKAQVIDSTSFGTEKEVPLFVSVPLIRSFVDEIVNRLEIHLDVSAQIVLNDVQILETAISDVVIQIFSIAQDKIKYDDILISQIASEQISAYASTRFKDTFVIPLSPARTHQKVEVDIELPLVTVAANLEPFRIFVDRLRLPSLDTGVTIIDATLAFEGTTYEIEMRPQFVQFAPTPIPQTTGRLKRLTYILPPVTATIPNIYEVIKIQPKLDIAPIPRMKLEIDVPPGFTSPFKGEYADIPLSVYGNEQIASIAEDTFQDVGIIYRYQSLSRVDFDYEIEIVPQTIDLRMAFYSEIYTMTNRVHTTEIDIQSEIDVAPTISTSITYTVESPLIDQALIGVLNFNIREIEIVPQTIDLRMAFYSEIYTMTNRVHTTEIDIVSRANVSVITPQEVIINYVIAPDAIDVGNSVRDFNIREIEIQLLIDSRMRFYSEILTMTNREMTIELKVFSGPIDVSTRHGRSIDVNYSRYADIPIFEVQNDLISTFITLSVDSSTITVDDDQITVDDEITFNTVPQNSFVKQIPSTYYEIEIQPLKEVVSFSDVATYDREIQLEISSFNETVSSVQTLPINRVIENDPLFVGLTQGELTLSQETKIDVILGSKYKGSLIESLQNQSIDELSNATFEDYIPLGKANFVQKYQTYAETPIRTVENEELEDYGNGSVIFTDIFTNRNIGKNVFANGTVTFLDPGFAESRIVNLSGDPITLFEANTFLDSTGSNTSVFGTNTEFLSDFREGGTLLTDTEKFFVRYLANNQYLEINVNPEENYNDVSVYREYFI